MTMYQQVVTETIEPDLKGQALFYLGMMHHFGKGTEIDLQMA